MIQRDQTSLDDTALAARSSLALKAYRDRSGPVPVQVDGEAPTPLPEPAFRLLLEALEQMARGKLVALQAMEAELTTQQAAELLGVSRPHLVKLLESGIIPFRLVGSHRRVLLSDVSAFRRGESKSREPIMQLDSIADAIRALARGEMIVVVDDDDRENEGDLVVAASKVTPEQAAFMIRHTSGILCAPLTAARARALQLEPMVRDNNAPLKTAFTVSVDYREGLTTGISAAERSATLRALANNNVAAEDFVRPGHVFPLVSRDGGVLVRSGHTEATTDLLALADLPQVGVLGELVNDDGTVKRLPSLIGFAREHTLKIISIADLIAYRRTREKLVERVREFEIETEIGRARAIAFATRFDHVQHLALVFGDILNSDAPLVRVHREEVISDMFARKGSLVSAALQRIKAKGAGVLVYLREGASGVSTPSASEDQTASEKQRDRDWRDVGIGAQILKDLGLRSITLLTAHRLDYIGLEGFDIAITGREIIGS
jgi:3,4-dihydroxy 2-butanone 4-phosphate synthase/GTP cyclohydrolase II